MTTKNFLRTRHEWLGALEGRSTFVAGLDLKKTAANDVYKAAGQKASINKDAFNLANSDEHNDVVAATINGLAARGSDPKDLGKLVLDLTSRNTYGTFCELSAYGFLLQGGHDFDIQMPMTGADILNPNGAALDGVIRLPQEVVFDIKAFGFHEHLVARLTERLSQDLVPDIVLAQDSWDVPVSELFALLSAQYSPLLQELKANRSALRGAIRFEVRPPARVQMTARELDPEKLAAENAEYAFNYAKQFARHKPFILIFVIHPWVSGALHQNFTGYVDQFTAAFARRTFCQFETDVRPVFGLTMGKAASLLSGILFVNAWAGNPPSELPLHRLFLNPNAVNPLDPSAVSALTAPYGPDMAVVRTDCSVPGAASTLRN
ncbi:hypothetical protein VQ042_18625 [Aurantimonas sp. A2-1-M11]|uniref:hypothetical protein n=1 Tax=Aurantimonas sp. A2-1-M11 TaxID=3113712 RepID=UPI002F95AF5F